MFKKLLRKMLLPTLILVFCLPAQAGMVGTAEIQPGSNLPVLADVAQQREWIRQQLVQGGVEAGLALKRVDAMTDAQVAMVHQRVDEMPAGADLGVILVIGLVLVITELMGYTDIVPNWPVEE